MNLLRSGVSHNPRCLLFDAAGSQAYLSLNQGTTRWLNGEFRPRRESELRERVDWARDVLVNELAGRPGLLLA
jgi:hypothetical protein